MNRSRGETVQPGMRTLLIAALFASGLAYSAPALPILDPELTIAGNRDRDGGKKKKDEEKEEDCRVSFVTS